MKLKRIFAALLCLCLLLALLPVSALGAEIVASGTCGANGDNLTWTLDSEGTLTISGEGEMADYQYKGNPWYSQRTKIKNIEICERVTNIGSNAFSGCDNLSNIAIPKGVTEIGPYAFFYCERLIDILIPEWVNVIGVGAFSRCSRLVSITLPTDMQDIGASAFSSCASLKKITIPNGVTSIASNVFWNCSSLESVKIPPTVTSIERLAFARCTQLTEIELPEGVTSIGHQAFDGCKSLNSIAIPSNVINVGSYAFRECDSLSTIIFPEKLQSIGYFAFQGCDSITTITIPQGVTNIGWAPFAGCASLKSIEVAEGNPNYCNDLNGILFNKAQTRLINCPASYAGAYNIPTSVTTIGDHAFEGCSNLTGVQIPESVAVIEREAFRNCDSLVSVTIPKSVVWMQTVSGAPFPDCDSLKSIYVKEDNPQYSSDAQGALYTKGLTELINCPGGYVGTFNVPESVIRIEDYAFEGCSKITDIALYEGVREVDCAFQNCKSLSSIHFPQSVSSIDSELFIGCCNLKAITILNPECKINVIPSIDLGHPDTTTIYGYANSTAQAYAEKYGYKFCSLGDIGGGSFAATRYSVTLNGDGKASGHFTLRDAEGKPLPNTDFSYEYSYRGKTYTMYSHTYTTDDKGNFTLTTPKLYYEPNGSNTFDVTYKLRLTGTGGSLKDEKFTLHVTITPLCFTETWSLHLGQEAGLLVAKAEKSNRAILSLKHKPNGKQDLTMQLQVNETFAASLDFLEPVQDATDNLLAASLKTGDAASNYYTYTRTLVDYDSGNTEHRKYLAAFMTFVLYCAEMSDCSTNDFWLTKAAMALCAKNAGFEKLFPVRETGMKFVVSANSNAKKIPVNVYSNSGLDVSLVSPLLLLGGKNQTTYSYSTSDDQLTGAITHKVGLKQDKSFSVLSGNLLPLFGIGGMGGYSDVNDVSLSAKDGSITLKTGDNSSGWQAFVDQIDQDSAYRAYTAQNGAYDELIKNSAYFSNLTKGVEASMDQEEFAFAVKTFGSTQNQLSYSDTVKRASNLEWTPSVGFKLTEELKFSFGWKIAYAKECEAEVANGFFSDGQAYRLADTDYAIEEAMQSASSLQSLVNTAMQGVGDLLAGCVRSTWDLVKNGVSNAGAAIKGRNGDSLWKVVITALKGESADTHMLQTASAEDEETAGAVGEPYYISILDEDGNEYHDILQEPLQLSLSFAKSTLSEEETAALAIYRYDREQGKYTRIGGTADLENRCVSAEIDRAGEYVLLADISAPQISELEVSDTSAKPVIYAKITDNSGVSEITMEIDGEIYVDASNGATYFDERTGAFRYQISEALSEGEHTVSISAKDLAGNTAAVCSKVFRVDPAPQIRWRSCPEQTIFGEDFLISAEAKAGRNDVAIGSVYAVLTIAQDDGTETRLLYQLAEQDGLWQAELPGVQASAFTLQLTAIDENGCYASSDVQQCTVVRGAAVSGSVESFLDENGETTLSLYREGETQAVYSTSVRGSSAQYAFAGVAAGRYILRVEKKGHTAREYTIEVAQTDLSQNVKICPVGDINGDGEVNMLDMISLYNHLNETEPLEGYAYACADVNADGEVGMLDMIRLYNHINETELLWQ